MPTEFDLAAYFNLKADNENKRALINQAPAPTQQSGGKAIHWLPVSVAKRETGHEPRRTFKNPVDETLRALRAYNAKVSWTVQNLMPPYALDVPVWWDVRAMDSVTADEASGALHEDLLKNEKLPFNEATLDTSVIAIVQTLMMAGFVPGIIAETIHPCHPDTWRAFQAATQIRRTLKLNHLHANCMSKNQMYVCCNNTQRSSVIRHPGKTKGIQEQQTSWTRTPAEDVHEEEKPKELGCDTPSMNWCLC